MSDDLPPLRMLLIMDNLAGHKTPALVVWLFAHGVMPVYTPLSGSWLPTCTSNLAIARFCEDQNLRGP